MDEPIFTYTWEQAVVDGVLVHPYPDIWHGLLVTQAVHYAIKEKALEREVTYDQVMKPFLLDAIMIVQAGSKADPDEYLWTKGMEGNATDQNVWMALNDAGGFTVMFPSDY